jgi:hypothetical protein
VPAAQTKPAMVQVEFDTGPLAGVLQTVRVVPVKGREPQR